MAEYTFFSSIHETFPRQTTFCAIKQTLNFLIVITQIYTNIYKIELNYKQQKNGQNIEIKHISNICEQEFSTEKLKYFELHENKSTIYQNLWDAIKAALRRKFISLNVYIRKKMTGN